MGTRGPQPSRPRATITIQETGGGERILAEWDGLDPEVCTDFDLIALEMGWEPGRLLEQQMRSFMARREAARNRP